MPDLLSPLAIAAQLGLGFATWILWKLILSPYLSPLRDIPGPPSSSLLYGNLERIISEEPGVPHREWASKYGGVVRYRGFLGEDRLFFTDHAALSHILVTHSYSYPKPNEVRGNLSRILGRGILFAEGDDHRRQKKIMAPAFSPTALRDLTPIFFEKAYKLRDTWTELVTSGTVDEKVFKSLERLQAYKEARGDDGEAVIDVLKWMSKVTLDIIGAAGFGYDFNALEGKENALGDAFSSMMSSSVNTPSPAGLMMGRVLGQIITSFPFILKYVPNARVKAVRAGFLTMEAESSKIVEQKKREVAEAGTTGGGKDLITLLLKANTTDAKMSDAELQGQMTTFLLAGHETTSTSLTWTLWRLAQNPNVQQKLRNEVRVARRLAKEQGREELGSDELNSLEYLDAVCREILRVENPVSATIRESAKDDLIPLSTPVRDRSGKMISSVPVKAGQTLFISITAPNYNKAIFGEDADEFRPERWLEGKVGEKSPGVGVYSQMLTFLAGPRACIGYKFSLLETKAILAVLVDQFTFAEREPGLAITRRSALVTRPLVDGEHELGYAMPLRVRVAKRED